MIKRLSFSIFLSIFLFASATSQSYKYTYYLDQHFASTDEASALFIGKGFADSGLFRVDCFDKKTGLLFMKAHFSDSSLNNLKGLSQTFYSNGNKETEGIYEDSYEQGIWTKWDSKGYKTDSLVYDKGLVFFHTEYSYDNDENVSRYEYTDSLSKKYLSTNYNKKVVTSTVEFLGNTGVRRDYDSSGLVKTKTLNTRTQSEAEFAGGNGAWRNFLTHNLNASTPVEKGAPEGIYTVIVRFIVDKDGIISDIKPETNFGYGMEAEVVRILKSSPPWIPAIQYGISVNAYRRQPITFLVEDNSRTRN